MFHHVTIVLVLVNPLFAIVVTDRRLSGANNTEESSKSGMLALSDAKLGYGFTGLAEVPAPNRLDAFETRFWITDALIEAARPASPDLPGLGMVETMSNLADIASEKFANLKEAVPPHRRVARKDKRMSFLFAGFSVDEAGALRPTFSLISNFESIGTPAEPFPQPRFRAETQFCEPGKAIAFSAGFELTQVDLLSTLELLSKARVPAREVISSAVRVIRSKVTPGGPVGPRCNSLVVTPDGGATAVDYHPDIAVPQAFMPAHVAARYGAEMVTAFVDASVSTFDPGETPDDATPIIAVPRVGRREPCPCGSGRRFKACHGR